MQRLQDYFLGGFVAEEDETGGEGEKGAYEEGKEGVEKDEEAAEEAGEGFREEEEEEVVG